MSQTAGQEVLVGDTLPSCQCSGHHSASHQKTHVTRNASPPPFPPTRASLSGPCASKSGVVAKTAAAITRPRQSERPSSPLGERRRLLPSKSVFCLTSPLLMEKEAIVRGRVPPSALVVFSSAWSPHRQRDYRPHTSQTPIGAHPLISKNNFSKRARRARGGGKRRASFAQPPPVNMPRDYCAAPAARQRYLHMKANGGAEIICDTFKKGERFWMRRASGISAAAD